MLVYIYLRIDELTLGLYDYIFLLRFWSVGQLSLILLDFLILLQHSWDSRRDSPEVLDITLRTSWYRGCLSISFKT